MNDSERIQFILRKVKGTDNFSELTLDFLEQMVLDFDIFHEIEQALEGKPSKFTEEVADALSYTPDPFAGRFDSDYDDV
jgi:hypothetical protein